MRSTAVNVITILIVLGALVGGGYLLLNKFKASADVASTAPSLDFNSDGKVDSLDLNMLISAVSDKSQNPKYDLNKDNTVNSLDIDYFNAHWNLDSSSSN